MRFCPRCHGRFPDGLKYCPNDGLSLPVDAADPRIGTVLYNQFELREIRGRGAMGTVYKAWQTGMERQVAVKILRTEMLRDATVVKRFDREARAVARLHHPNIVTFFLIAEADDGVPFVAMEYVEGDSLADVLDRAGKLTPDRALRIARQVTSALADAHAEGVVHRDLKPANIVLAQRRRAADFVKVLDFGIAKILGLEHEQHGGGLDAESLSRSGRIFGTPAYMAPEQATGGEMDARVDLYSLGVILYEMLTGEIPFDGTGMSVLVAHMTQDVTLPSVVNPDLDPRLDALVMRAMEKDPAKRFQNAEEMSDAIEAAAVEIGADRSSWPSFSGRMPASGDRSGDRTGDRSVDRPVKPTPPSPADAVGGSSPGLSAGSSPTPVIPRPPIAAGSSPVTGLPATPPARGSSSASDSSVAAGVVGAQASQTARLGGRALLWGGLGVLAVAGVTLLITRGMPAHAPAVIDAGTLAVHRPVVTKLDAGAPPIPKEPPLRTITVGEAGYAVRVQLPRELRSGNSYTMIFDVLDPSGRPVTLPTLAASIEDESDIERPIKVPASASPGHYVLEQKLAYGGRYHMHVYPVQGDDKLHIWFDFSVEGPEPPRPPPRPHPAAPPAGHPTAAAAPTPTPPRGPPPSTPLTGQGSTSTDPWHQH